MNRRTETTLEPFEPGLVLSASEIGAYTYCPESWVLDRLRAPHSSLGEQRRMDGSRAHQRIGRRIDRLTALEQAARVTRFAILMLLLGKGLRPLKSPC